jgi:hypothetical protein
MRGAPVSKLVRCSGIRVHRNVTPVVSIRNFMMGVSCLLDDRPNGGVGRITQCSPTPAAATNGGPKHTARLCKTVRCPHRRALIHGLPPPPPVPALVVNAANEAAG